jgi:hypothetical protein
MAIQPKHSFGIAAKSIGKVPSDLDSSTGVSQDTTTDSLSSHRLESIADLQHKEEEIQDLWKLDQSKTKGAPSNHSKRWNAIGKTTCGTVSK